MSTLSRREFAQASLGSLLTFSLLETILRKDLLAAEVKPIAVQWLAKVNEMSRDAQGQKLSQLDWQKQIESLFAKIELDQFLKYIDFAKLEASVVYRDKGERSLQSKLPKVEGLPTELVFGHQIFALKKDRSVPPHGHDNMATAFLIMKGNFQGRHFDRLEDEPKTKTMIIRPTLDKAFKAGDSATISDFKDNIHWFTATSETAFIFNIHVMGVNKTSGKQPGRVYCDPNGEKLSDGRIRAKRISGGEATKLYG